MSTKLIAYDLNSPGQDHDRLTDAIKEMGAWWHHLDSTWLVKTELPVVEVRDRLKPYMDSNDELLVADVTGDVRAWRGSSDRASDWLKNKWD